MSSRRRRDADEPVALGDALASVGHDFGLPDPAALRDLAAIWPEVAGPAVVQHVTVRSLREGVLSVAVDSPAWATQLRYLGDDLLARLSARLGTGVVESLRVVVESGVPPRP